MKTNYKITRGTDYQGDKCYRVSYEEYGTLYTIPEPHYTKQAVQSEIRMKTTVKITKREARQQADNAAGTLNEETGNENL